MVHAREQNYTRASTVKTHHERGNATQTKYEDGLGRQKATMYLPFGLIRLSPKLLPQSHKATNLMQKRKRRNTSITSHTKPCHRIGKTAQVAQILLRKSLKIRERIAS